MNSRSPVTLHTAAGLAVAAGHAAPTPPQTPFPPKYYDVVILGGGFAGAELARRLGRLLPHDVSIALVSRHNFITYNPLLPEVVGASILPGHVVAPLRQMIGRSDLRMAEVAGIDFDARVLHPLQQDQAPLRYGQLVIACGLRANLDRVPGMCEHALPLKTLGDALFLRNQIIERLEQAAQQSDPIVRRRLTRFAVIGGGFSGVEVAGEIADFLRSTRRYYRTLEAEDCRVMLIHSGDHLLPEISPRLGEFTRRKMSRQGIEIHLGARARSVDAKGVLLPDGRRVDAGTVICTIGSAPHALVLDLGLALEKGRIVTGVDMSVPDHEGVWAMGDCAAVPNAHDNRPCPPTAQFAVRQARQLAVNIMARMRSQPTHAFRYRPIGQLSSIGHNKAVAEIYHVRVSGFVAWLLWRGVYLLKIPTFARKVRIFFAWNWEMLFSNDIASLNFERSLQEPVVAAARERRNE